MRVKQMKQNIKGFTIVEILAAVVILGVLSLIAIVSVSSVLDRAEENHYKTQKDTLIMAAKSYAQDNRNLLPKNVGDSRIITLKELQDAKYIGDVVDRSKNACDEAEVTIFKYSKNDYSYSAYLKCGSKIIGNESGEVAGPVIKLKNNQDNNNYQNPYFTYEILGNGENDGKIISYSYQIYKYSVLVYDSGSISVSKAEKIDEKKVSLKEYVPGNFSIVFTAVNHYGGTTTEKINKEYQDSNGPECGDVTPKRNGWDGSNEVTISIKCIDKEGSGCARDTFIQQFTADSKVNSITIVDNLGNKTACPVETYIDTTRPTKPVITNPYENIWSNESYKLKVKSIDLMSGIAYYEYRYPNSENASEREWKIYEDSKRDEESLTVGEYVFETTPFSKERNEYVEIRACDQAGNCSETAQSMIKIDKTKPTCSLDLNGTWNSDGFYSSNVIVSLSNKKDSGGSGLFAFGMGTSTSPNYNSLTEKTQGATNGITWYGYVKDGAGNVNTCNTDKFSVSLRSIPEFTYTGSYEIVDDSNNIISNPDSWTGNWKIRFLTSGKLTFIKLNGAANGIDTFLVGGGGNGGNQIEAHRSGCHGYSAAGAGGGGGYRYTKKGLSVNLASYSIVIGQATQTTSAFGYSAAGGQNGGAPGHSLSTLENRARGGTGGATGGDGGLNAAAGGDGQSGGYEFDDPSTGMLYGGGGGGGHAHNGGSESIGMYGAGGNGGGAHGNATYYGIPSGHSAAANTGGGGGGASYFLTQTNYDPYYSSSGYTWVKGIKYDAGTGGSGIVVIRNKR